MILKCVAVVIVFCLSRCECAGEDATAVEVSGGGNRVQGKSEEEDPAEGHPQHYVGGRAYVNNLQEGRKKKKKLIKILGIMALIKAILVPKFLGLVKLLTAKAYLVAVASLVFAALATSSSPEHRDTEEVINLVPKERSLGSHDLAYRKWRKGSVSNSSTRS